MKLKCLCVEDNSEVCFVLWFVLMYFTFKTLWFETDLKKINPASEIFTGVKSVTESPSLSFVYVTLDHNTSKKYEELSWINKLSVDIWFVMIGQYLAEIQL